MELYQRLILGGFLILTVTFILLVGRNLVKYVWREPLWFARRINLKLFVIFLLSILVPAGVLSVFALLTVETLFDSLVNRSDSSELRQIANHLERQIYRSAREAFKAPINIGRLRRSSEFCVITKNSFFGTCVHLPRYLLLDGRKQQFRQIQFGRHIFFQSRVGSNTALYRLPEELSDQYVLVKSRIDSVNELLADRRSIIYQLRTNLAFLLAVSVFCALWLGVFLGRNFTQFFSDLIKGLDELSRGNLEYRMPSVRSPEFYFIKKKFDSTASKLKNLLEALNQKSQELTAILDNCGVAIAIYESGLQTYKNLLYQTLIGADDTKVINVVDNAIREIVDKRISTPFTVSKILNVEDKILSVFITVLDIQNKKVVVSIRDVTRVVQEERNVLLKDILSKVAHEIRNPLVPVENRLKKIKSLAPPALVSEIQDAIDELSHFKKLLSELLSNIRINEIKLSTFSLMDLIYELSENLKPVSKAVNLIAFNSLSSEVITSDRTILTLALKNLIENGFEFAYEGTNVIVAAAEDDEFIHITVENVGDPIPTENRTRIFEPYFSTNPRGTGLGLYISRIALNSLGGRLTLERSDSECTIFKISIPRQLAKSTNIDVA